MSTNLQRVPVPAPGASLSAYMQAVNTFPVLEPDEERNLAERLYYDGDIEAAQRLILSHLRFVVHIARSYTGYGLPLSDLVQEGNVGLMKAVKRFDPNRGVRLVSFAVHWIKAEMHEFILRNWRIVKVATTKAQRKLFFNLRQAKKSLAWLTNDEAHAVAEDLGVDVREVRRMEGRLASTDLGFDGGVDDDDSPIMAPVHYLEDKRYDPAVQAEQADFEEVSERNLHEALAELDERSRDIIVSRWLSETKATLHELADTYGVSAERIRQLEKNAMKKVRGSMEVAA